jgi:hypothetical protein
MATHELWDGGPAVANYNRSQYPSFTYNAANATIKKLDVAQHHGTPYAMLRKVLDFKYDVGLQDYFRNNAVTAADLLNVLLLPAGCLLLGTYVEVERASGTGATSLAAKFGTAGGIVLGNTAGAVEVDLNAAASMFSAPNGAWITANGAMSLATAYALVTPDMVQLNLSTMTTHSLAGFGDLRLNVTAMIAQASENIPTNY